MSYQSMIEDDDKVDREYQRFFLSREQTLKEINELSRAEVLVIGGGIHGAAFARLSALAGLKTVLLEKEDYAFGTSSRSSKIAHGGVRYLEMLDFKQVFDGIKSRENLFRTASHLAKPSDFLIPISKGQWWLKFKMGFGLAIYDLFARVSGRKRTWVGKDLVKQVGYQGDSEPIGAWKYQDGLMNDTRIVVENIVAARQEGALCINHAQVVSISQQQTGEVEVGWTDKLSGIQNSIRAGVVVNCAGPWVASAGRVKPGPLAEKLRYSRGSHLVFDKEWTGPAVLVPMKEQGRYYFVWPYLGKTFVGTTEREVKTSSLDPYPSEDEINEILTRLERDFPYSGLDRSSLYYCYAGVRTLYQSAPNKEISEVSRRHNWSFTNGVLSLSGGKFTSAYCTVEEGMKHLIEISSANIGKPTLFDRPLPGHKGGENVERFLEKAKELGIPEDVIDRAVSRYGSSVKFFLQDDRLLEVLGSSLLRGEVEIAIDIEQAETIEDLLRRRLDLEYMPGYGLDLIEDIAAILKEKRPDTDVDTQVKEYKQRLEKVKNLLGG